MTVSKIQELFIEAGQAHLFKHVPNLSDAQINELNKNLESVVKREPPAKLLQDCKEAMAFVAANGEMDTKSISPLPSSSYESIIGNVAMEQKYYKLGLEAIMKGEVAVILMAGGQGTRLGSSSPKGCYDINLPSHKSLFQIQAEKLITLQKLANNAVIPWYIMTSKPTRAPTEHFFKQNNWFGLKAENIVFFNQGTLPAFDISGEKLFLADETSLVQSPDGNGGLYRAIKDNQILADMESRGIKHVYMYCVDNVLSKLADPVFVGFAINHGFELATKAVRKRDAHESVGLIATRNNHPCVIEYSEISDELAEAVDSDGLLRLRAGNIVNHYYSIELLKRDLNEWCDNMPYHVAKKKIPYYDNVNNKYIKPTEPNGIKLEQFIFDVFPTIPLSKFGCLEVERTKEFSPLKNGPGSANDNPETSRLAYLNLGTKWLKEAGAIIDEDVLVEVSGRLSYSGENLQKYNGKTFTQTNSIVGDV